MGSRSRHKATRARPRRRLLIWVVVTFLVWGGLAGRTIYLAKKNAEAGESALRSLTDLSDPIALDLEVVAAALGDGEDNLSRADGYLGSSILYPIRIMPVLGRQLGSSRALVRAALEVTTSVQPVVAQVREMRASPDELDRVAFLNGLSEELNAIHLMASSADLGPSDGLIGPLFEGRLEMETQLEDLAERAGSYQKISEGLALFLSDGTYLVLGANNAEMRLGSGMHLSVGRLQISDGSLELLDLTHAELLAPVTGAEVLDQDVFDQWGFLGLEDDFRKLGYSARFDEHVAPQALELWRAHTGEVLDGVVLLDPFVLEALSSVLGPVSVEGEEYNTENLLSYLLKDQYATVEIRERDNDVRRDHLARLASELSTLFRAGSWDPLELVRSLGSVSRGRHLMLYSTSQPEQEAWEQLGVAGSIEGNETGLFWLNTGASKLDPFLDVSIEVTTTLIGARRLVEMEMSTFNRASSSLPIYTVGPWESLGVPSAGVYQGRLAAYAPNGALDAHFNPTPRLEVIGPDGLLWVMGTGNLQIEPGETFVMVYSYTVDASRETIDILPSGRFPTIRWTWDGVEFDDQERRTIDLAG